MDRKTLKALSWSQMIDKIWWILLITVIASTIVGLAEGVLSTIVFTPIAIIAGIAAAAGNGPEVLEILNMINPFASLIVTFGSLLIAGPFSMSLVMIFMGITNGMPAKVEDTFKGFKMYWKSVGLYMLLSIYTSLWAMLFFIPGIVKSYSYAMAPYILAENPTLKANEAITESRRMMNGHKAELFILDLSFIGWILLTLVTFGIASIWYSPYHQTAHANFYKKLKGEI